MKKWECTVCGYIHEGEEPPEECPVCGVGKEKFTELKETEEAPAAAETQKATAVPLEHNKEEEEKLPEQQESPAGPDFTRLKELILRFHLHPITVHSPNGIVPMAVFFLCLAFLFPDSSFSQAAVYSLVFVLLAMPAVIYTGYVTWKEKYSGAKTRVFKKKIICSGIAGVLLPILAIWGIIQPDIASTASSGRLVFLILSLILLSSIGIAGHLGGKLVFAKKK